jgi:uncharacterized membrane protein YedE/YeeE
MNEISTPTERPPWPPLLAGISLGLVLLLTFLLTGHGLGATGFTTALSAVIGQKVAPAAIEANAYLGGMVEAGYNPLSSWITWQVVGVAIGALIAAIVSGSFRVQVDGARRASTLGRVLLAVTGGIASGFGARLAAGCTSGMGLSGSATLAVAGFVFLGGFFVMGIIASLLIKRVWQ